MPIRFRCHQCGQKLRVGDDKVARRAKCPRCKNMLTVPSMSTEPEEPPGTETEERSAGSATASEAAVADQKAHDAAIEKLLSDPVAPATMIAAPPVIRPLTEPPVYRPRVAVAESPPVIGRSQKLPPLKSSPTKSPVKSPPVDAPPVDAPHVDSRPAHVPSFDSPPVDAPPIESRSSESRLSESPPEEISPAPIPPQEIPVVLPPPEELPSLKVASVELPSTELPSTELPPVQTAPAEAAPVETLPAEVPPAEIVPAEIVPAEIVPAETPPAETAPVVTAPVEVAARESPPVETPLPQTSVAEIPQPKISASKTARGDSPPAKAPPSTSSTKLPRDDVERRVPQIAVPPPVPPVVVPTVTPAVPPAPSLPVISLANSPTPSVTVPPSVTDASDSKWEVDASVPSPVAGPKVSLAASGAPEIAGGAAAPVVRTGAAAANRLPEIVVYDEDVEWEYESPTRSSPTESVVDYDKVAVPRRVLYVQGILLGTLALAAFILGWMMRGGRSADEAALDGPHPCELTGKVTYSAGVQERPDDGSVVIVVPQNQRPGVDSKVAFEGLRPGDPLPLADNTSVRSIRSLGGDYARTDETGTFHVRVADAGDYYVLVISSRSPRAGDEPLEKRDIAQVGRYFQNPLDLLADRQYRWQQLVLRRNQSLDVQF